VAIKLVCPNPQCGKHLSARDDVAGRRVKCPACGFVFAAPTAQPSSAPLPSRRETLLAPSVSDITPAPSQDPAIKPAPRAGEGAGRGRNRVAAGLFALLLGPFGVHHFYLGAYGAAIASICVTWLTCGFGVILPIVEGIVLLTMDEIKFDKKYNARTPRALEFAFSSPPAARPHSRSLPSPEPAKPYPKPKKAWNTCAVCGSKMTTFEMSAKMGKCARCMLSELGLVEHPDMGYVFSQAATYQGGIAEYPTAGKRNGFFFVYEDGLSFLDNSVRWRMPYGRILRAELDFFQPSGVRAVLGGLTTIMLQRVRNNVAVSFLDTEGTERTAKFHIHGALSIPGEEHKATEVLNHILRFKRSFARPGEPAQRHEDRASKLGLLAELKEKGLITESEYECKRREIIDSL